MNPITIIKFVTSLVSLIKMLSKIFKNFQSGASIEREKFILRREKKKLDKMIDDGVLDDLNDNYGFFS